MAVGGHDLRSADSLALLRQPGGLFDAWRDRLVTSNVRAEAEEGGAGRRGLGSTHHRAGKAKGEGSDAGPTTPLGGNYRLLRGYQGTVLVLGFL